MDDDEIANLLKDPVTPSSKLRSLAGRSQKWDRMLATHPNAPPAILSKLAKSADRLTRRGVTLNPQTPKNELVSLASSFPGEFFLNPAFDLLLLEEPNLLQALPVGVMKNILKRPDCPRSFLRWAVVYGGRSHHLALVSREALSREMLQQIAAGSHGPAAEVAANRLMRGDFLEDPP
ncbi:MAG: hypothetical protein IPH39_05660 [Sulfuritalea sp.]|nr:hypothetical protein [Sulfuritalea sp.]